MSAVSLFEKYGGHATVEKLVQIFYRKVLDSETLAPYFAKRDVDALIRHQTAFMSQVLGGPRTYSGRALSAAHRGLNVTESDFFEVATLLQETLVEGAVEPADVETIMGIVSTTKDQIVAPRAATDSKEASAATAGRSR